MAGDAGGPQRGKGSEKSEARGRSAGLRSCSERAIDKRKENGLQWGKNLHEANMYRQKATGRLREKDDDGVSFTSALLRRGN